MRDIKVFIPKTTDGPTKHFRDAANLSAIRCSCNLDQRCTPNCAACEIVIPIVDMPEFRNAVCNKGGFTIGKVIKT